MIKFFRTFRQNLLLEGKNGKYLKYAIGEIILVMIGILLALQINNWNDNWKRLETEKKYYCKLLEDFDLDKEQLEKIQKSIDNSIKSTNEVLLALDAGDTTRHYLLNKYVSAIRRDIYVPRNKTFEELIFSGNLNIISDLKIKNELIQYNSDLESNLTVIQKNRDEFVREVYNLTNSSVEFGLQEVNFVNKLINPQVIETFPKDTWTNDKNSALYKGFQNVLLYNMATAGREKQVLDTIIKLMQSPYELLEAKCQIF
jgi:hypothetical protein